MDLSRLSLVALKRHGAFEQLVVPVDYAELNTPIYRANWKNKIVTQDRWVTSISVSPITGKTEAVSLRDRPLFSQQITLTSHTKEEFNRLFCDFHKHSASDSTRCPVYTDRAKVQADSNVGETEIYISTKLRRFFSGQNVVIVPADHKKLYDINSFVVSGFVQQIVSVAEDRIITNALSFDVKAGYFVYPLFDAQTVISITGNTSTCKDTNIDANFNEISGENTMPGMEPYSLEYFDGYPILQMKPSKKYSLPMFRYSESFSVSRSDYVGPYDVRPLLAGTIPLVFHSREKYFQLLSLFNNVKGRETPFWVTNYQKLIEVVSYPANDEILISRLQDINTLRAMLKYLSFETTTGYKIAEVISITDANPYYNIKFNGSILDFNPIEIRQALKVRSARDALQTSWATFENCEVTLEVTEDV